MTCPIHTALGASWKLPAPGPAQTPPPLAGLCPEDLPQATGVRASIYRGVWTRPAEGTDQGRQEADVPGLPSAATLPCLGPCQSPIRRQAPTHLPAPQMVKPPIHCSPEHLDGGHKECGAWRQEVLASVGEGLCQSQACPPDRETGAVVPSNLSQLTEPPCSTALTSLGLSAGDKGAKGSVGGVTGADGSR